MSKVDYGQLTVLAVLVLVVRGLRLLHLGVRDVLVAGEEQHHLTLLVLDGHDVQQAPEAGPCNKRVECVKKLVEWRRIIEQQWGQKRRVSGRGKF